MNLVSIAAFLVLISSVTDQVRSDPQQRGRRTEFSDDDIIEALAILLSEVEQDEVNQRNGRQQSGFNFDEFDSEAARSRGFARQDFEDVLGTCTTTGYEVR